MLLEFKIACVAHACSDKTKSLVNDSWGRIRSATQASGAPTFVFSLINKKYLNIYWVLYQILHIDKAVSLRGVNFEFWSHLGFSWQNAIIFSREGLV